MARYGKIESGFWNSPKIRRLSQEARYLMLYLLSCPQGNAIGCFVLRDGYIGADLGWPADVVGRGVQELIDKGLVERDDETSLLRILGWWGHNGIENANVAKHVVKEIAALPACRVKDNLVDAVFSLTDLHPTAMQTLSEQLGKPFGNGLETVSEPSRNQEPSVTLPNSSYSSAPAVAGAPAAKVEKPKRERGMRINPDWRPSEQDRQFARELGFTDAEIDRIYPRFVDYWIAKAGVNGAKRDWSATWRNWIRNEQVKARPTVAAKPQPKSVDWDRCVADYCASKGSRWAHQQLGPEPGYRGCQAPPEILQKHGYGARATDTLSST